MNQNIFRENAYVFLLWQWYKFTRQISVTLSFQNQVYGSHCARKS
jgi:hypothetical protein